MPRPKKTPGRKTGTKSDFVRSQPADLPAKAVVEKAKAAGITLTEKHVYAIRADDRARAKKAAAGAGRGAEAPRRRGRPPKGAAPALRTTDASLRAAALEIGLARAIEVLKAEHA